MQKMIFSVAPLLFISALARQTGPAPSLKLREAFCRAVRGNVKYSSWYRIDVSDKSIVLVSILKRNKANLDTLKIDCLEDSSGVIRVRVSGREKLPRKAAVLPDNCAYQLAKHLLLKMPTTRSNSCEFVAGDNRAERDPQRAFDVLGSWLPAKTSSGFILGISKEGVVIEEAP